MNVLADLDPRIEDGRFPENKNGHRPQASAKYHLPCCSRCTAEYLNVSFCDLRRQNAFSTRSTLCNIECTIDVLPTANETFVNPFYCLSYLQRTHRFPSRQIPHQEPFSVTSWMQPKHKIRFAFVNAMCHISSKAGYACRWSHKASGVPFQA